jgi:hypothetical protein
VAPEETGAVVQAGEVPAAFVARTTNRVSAVSRMAVVQVAERAELEVLTIGVLYPCSPTRYPLTEPPVPDGADQVTV